MTIVALTLFMHIAERHRCLFISLAVVPSAESFALIAIISRRVEEIWGRELMETTPRWLRGCGGAPCLWFTESCMRAPFCCCQRQVLNSYQNSKRERRSKGKGNHQSSEPQAACGFSLELELGRCGGAPTTWELFQAAPRKQIKNSVCLIFSNQGLFGAGLCVMWKSAGPGWLRNSGRIGKAGSRWRQGATGVGTGRISPRTPSLKNSGCEINEHSSNAGCNNTFL